MSWEGTAFMWIAVLLIGTMLAGVLMLYDTSSEPESRGIEYKKVLWGDSYPEP